jgi:hypothetical protein
MSAVRVLGWLVLAATGCGGIAEGRSERPASKEGSAGEATKSATNSETQGTPGIEGDTALGDCKLGKLEGSDEDCAWVAEGRCYTSRDMACNCACPRSRDSACVSGFEAGPDGHVWVSCD